MKRTHSPEAQARRRNQNAAARFPLLAHAGLLDQIGVKVDWDAQQVSDDTFARALRCDEARTRNERQHQRQYAAYVRMLDATIGAENRDEVIADYEARWAGHDAMQQWPYKLDYLCRYLATFLKRPPLVVYHEAQQQAQAL